jgi:hypothetical protein
MFLPQECSSSCSTHMPSSSISSTRNGILFSGLRKLAECADEGSKKKFDALRRTPASNAFFLSSISRRAICTLHCKERVSQLDSLHTSGLSQLFMSFVLHGHTAAHPTLSIHGQQRSGTARPCFFQSTTLPHARLQDLYMAMHPVEWPARNDMQSVCRTAAPEREKVACYSEECIGGSITAMQSLRLPLCPRVPSVLRRSWQLAVQC